MLLLSVKFINIGINTIHLIVPVWVQRRPISLWDIMEVPVLILGVIF